MGKTEKKTRIVILGGGYGGVHAAKKLYKTFGGDGRVEITLIDRNPYHTLMTELHEVAGGRAEPESVLVSFHKIFGGRRVNVITDRIRTIDFDARRLTSDSAEYAYDFLVLGPGGEPEDYGIPGVRENTFSLWSFEDALRIREHVEGCYREAARERDAERRRRLLTFAVAGGGFTGVEMAGELMEWRRTLCRKNGIDERDVRIVILELMDNILPIFPEKLQNKAFRFLNRHGVEILLNAQIVEAGQDVFRIQDGREVQGGTLIWTAGVMGAEFAGNLSLTRGKCSNRLCNFATTRGTCGVKECSFDKENRYIDGKRGRLLANERMQSVDYQNVYLVGDVVWYMEGKRVIPQIVETALQTAETAAHNITAGIRGGEMKTFHSNYHGFMVSIGGRYGVAHVVGISLTGFLAMAAKHLINLHYLFGLAGVNAVWDYLRHHFLDVPDRRSIVGGHASARVRLYWVAVLRVFTGAMWLIEGIKKVLDGWMNPDNIFLAAAADAETAATASVSAAADVATAATAAGAQAAPYAAPLISQPTGIYTWIMDTFVAQAPFAFQVLIVAAEIGIGLALIGGLFTFAAAAASIGLCLMFILGAMASREILWYIVAAIVLLGGAGRALGLDYWVIPWLKRWWNGRTLAKRTYLYIDEPVGKK